MPYKSKMNSFKVKLKAKPKIKIKNKKKVKSKSFNKAYKTASNSNMKTTYTVPRR